MSPALRKATRVIGHHLVLRNAGPADAPFVHLLRTDRRKSQHLSATSEDLQEQVDWLTRYSQDDTQAYFIIEDRQGDPLGTVRLYDAQGASFCWGSWIIRDGTAPSHAYESALLVYHYALWLGFTAAHFDVRKANSTVWRFHERFGAVRRGETSRDYLYTIGLEAIKEALARYARYLPDAPTIIRE